MLIFKIYIFLFILKYFINSTNILLTLLTNANTEECSLPREIGKCNEKLPKWYFDFTENKCLPFHYSGCSGNGNNFDTRDECEHACPPRIGKYYDNRHDINNL